MQATHGQGVELEPSEEMALAAMQIDKQTARQLLNSSLPVPSDVLMGHQKALAQIATKAHQTRLHVSASCVQRPRWGCQACIDCSELRWQCNAFEPCVGPVSRPMHLLIVDVIALLINAPQGGVYGPMTTILLCIMALRLGLVSSVFRC